MSWPTLPAFSPNSFVDHFDAGSLDATKWTAVTSGTGSVSLSDSNAVIDSAAANQAAFIYRNAQLDLTKSQLWMVCLSFPAALAGGQVDQPIKVLNGASAPAAATKATIDARTVLQGAVMTGQTAGNVFSGGYFSSASTATWWPAPSGPFAVFSAASGLIEPIQTNDYYVFGLEIDGVNQRWRMMGWGQAFATAGTYTFNQGWRLFALTDWVTWANTRVQTGGLWLAIGHLFTDTASRSQTNVEWVRYAEAPAGNTVLDGWCNALASGAGTSQIKHTYSYDGQIWIPEDRTTAAITAGGASPDNNGVAHMSAAYDGASTDWMFYQGSSGANTFICAASASHVAAGTGQTGPWTKSGSNPLLSQGTAGAFDDAQLVFPVVLMDLTETDSNKRWKMLYGGKHTADGFHRCMYATAAAASGPWTKQGVVIDVGGAGANDQTNVYPGCVVRYQGVWYVLYEGHDSNNAGHAMWATGTDLATLTKQGTLFTPDNVSQSLTANLSAAPGRTVSVASTTGYRKDASVVLSQSSASDTYSTSKVRKIVNATTLELYHGLTGFLTTTPAKIRQTTSSPNFTTRWCALGADGNWYFDLNFWEPFTNSGDGASYNATPYEEGYLAKHSNASPVGATPVIQDLPYVTSRGFNSDSESFENLTLLTRPLLVQSLLAVSTASPLLIKQSSKLLATTSTASATVIKNIAHVLAATATGTPVVVKQTARTFAATATGIAAVGKRISKTFSATSVGVALLQTLKSVFGGSAAFVYPVAADAAVTPITGTDVIL